MRVLVTGASGGIGGAIVRRFLDQGAGVIAHDLRPPKEDLPEGATFVSGDLTSAAGHDAIREAIGDDPLDCVVAAHGVEGSGAIATIPADRAQRIMDLNFMTVLDLFDTVQDALGRGDGAFVLVSSQAGLAGEANNGAYCASKFGLVGWARVMAGEHERTGIHVHAVCPGCTDTELLQGALLGMAQDEGISLEEMNARRIASIPAGRLARPSEIAALVVHLAGIRGGGAAVAPITGGEVLA
jgi:NAD(P)-dependent dehydrogenase (short-subunit alcohol dehydrogenase family)